MSTRQWAADRQRRHDLDRAVILAAISWHALHQPQPQPSRPSAREALAQLRLESTRRLRAAVEAVNDEAERAVVTIREMGEREEDDGTS